MAVPSYAKWVETATNHLPKDKQQGPKIEHGLLQPTPVLAPLKHPASPGVGKRL